MDKGPVKREQPRCGYALPRAPHGERSTTRNIRNYGELAATTATEKNTGKSPRYAAKL